MRGKLGVISLFLCFLPTLSSAATYYVAKTGNNANSCGQAQSPSTPKLTIQAGVSCATTASDTVIVQGGTYIESVSSWNSGAAGKPITLKAAPGETIVWRTPVTDLTSLSGPVAIFDRSYIRIEGFTFDGSMTRSVIRVLNTTGNKDSSPIQGIEIINNKFSNNGNNAASHGNATYMVYLQGTGRGETYNGGTVNTVTGNTFTANFGVSIITSGSSDTYIAKNQATGNKGSKNQWNANWYESEFLKMAPDTINSIVDRAIRNVVELNTYSNVVKDAYVETTMEASGVRIDVNTDNNIIRRNLFHDIGNDGVWGWDRRTYGVYIENGSDNNQVYENVVYNIGEACFAEGSWPTNVTTGNQYINNVGYNCGQAGLALINSKQATAKNNIFTGSIKAQIYVSNLSVTAGGHIFSHNDYWKSGTTLIGKWNGDPTRNGYDSADLTLSQWKSLTGESGALSVDPRFTNPPSDFHLQADSPVKGAGEQGLDMGAYPVTSSPAVPPSPAAPTNLLIQVQ